MAAVFFAWLSGWDLHADREAAHREVALTLLGPGYDSMGGEPWSGDRRLDRLVGKNLKGVPKHKGTESIMINHVHTFHLV